jgi:nucleoside phosphorylase
MSADTVEFGFVAALEREVSGLVRDWDSAKTRIEGVDRIIYRKQGAALICAGTGVARAYAASRVLVEQCSPRVLVSIGFAGGLGELCPGSVVVPATVVEAATGKSFATVFGVGQLATLDQVAGKELKDSSRARFGAVAVDMEASGVAAAAVEWGKEFVAIKAISDGEDEDLGFLSDFVKPEGFETGRFVAHIATRPWLWKRVAALQANSELATASLKEAVVCCMSDWQEFSTSYSSPWRKFDERE